MSATSKGLVTSLPPTTAKRVILFKTIDIAKERIFEDKTINEIAYDLGFKHPQHFTRLFKQKVGMSPLKWRGVN